MATLEEQEKQFSIAFAEAQDIAAALAESLPQRIEVAALGVKEKAPFQLLSVREPLIWRTEELARNACVALSTESLTVAAILTRAIVESVAVLWRLRRLINAAKLDDLGRLNSDIMSIFAASRTQTDHQWSYQILKFVDQLDRSVPGIREQYDNLSEIAHPNWEGTAGMYSVLDRENHVAYFGINKRLFTGRKMQIAILLSASLELFENTYNQISQAMPAWLEKMTPFDEA